MKYLPLALGLLLLGGPVSASPQSLVELAKKEKERRRRLRNEARQAQADENLDGSASGATPVAETSASDGRSNDSGGASSESPASQTARQGDESNGNGVGSIVLASFQPQPWEQSDEGKDVEFIRAGGGAPPRGPGGSPSRVGQFRMPGGSRTESLLLRGAVYADWFRAAYDSGLSANQVSTRVKMTAGRHPGHGWRLFLDIRDRFNNASASRNQVVIYDARAIYEDQRRPVELSLGQMNLYNSVGVGQLLGAFLGYRLSPVWTVGGYGGLEHDIYSVDVDPSYQKYGFYVQYEGDRARSAALSYNTVRFGGKSERAFLYTSALLPFRNVAVLYGNLEYELSNNLTSADRLSHLFLNARYNISKSTDVTAHYSSGKGLDFHRFLIEQSQDPDRHSPELERFYYSETYGIRFSVRPHRRLRIYVAQRESEQKDRFIRNHTTQFGGSALNVAGSGLSMYGNYNVNRGDASESDSYQISLSRSFGPLSWTAYYSSTFNGIRIDASTGLPQIVRIPDRNTVSNDLFFSISRALAVSLQHDFSSEGDADENTLFFRVIYRF